MIYTDTDFYMTVLYEDDGVLIYVETPGEMVAIDARYGETGVRDYTVQSEEAELDPEDELFFLCLVPGGTAA